jgi:trans-aconitate methyltransferase
MRDVTILQSTNKWDPTLYDDKLAFVSDYGKGIVAILNPQQGESILDLGCGTGDLTKEIQSTGAVVTGMDASSEMLMKAMEKYPDIPFIHADATNFQMKEKFDAVFSNAALHWMKAADKVAKSVFDVLHPVGRFVAEFGGQGNVQVLVYGILDVLTETYGVDATTRMPWYFPSIGQYSQLLEDVGFRVVYAHHFDRPTILADGEAGLDPWLESFADDFFPEFTSKEREGIYGKIKDKLRPQLFKDGNWVADYKRLRVVAVKG